MMATQSNLNMADIIQQAADDYVERLLAKGLVIKTVPNIWDLV